MVAMGRGALIVEKMAGHQASAMPTTKAASRVGPGSSNSIQPALWPSLPPENGSGPVGR